MQRIEQGDGEMGSCGPRGISARSEWWCSSQQGSGGAGGLPPPAFTPERTTSLVRLWLMLLNPPALTAVRITRRVRLWFVVMSPAFVRVWIFIA